MTEGSKKRSSKRPSRRKRPLSRLLLLVDSSSEPGEPAPAEAWRAVAPSEVEAPDAGVAPVAGREIRVTDETLSEEEVERVLQERARALARVPPSEEKGEVIEVVVFALGEEVYGIEAGYVDSIHYLRGLTPVPCTPDFVLGVVNLRGRILSVVDLHRFLGLDKVKIDEGSQIIVVKAAGLEVGIVASEVRSIGPLPLEELGPALPTAARIAAEYTRGVTPDMVVLLDLEALMRDPRMTVQQEIG